MKMGIEISDLLNSSVFMYQFDFQEWPSIHANQIECLRPYNSTIFALKNSYSSVFPDLADENEDHWVKFYKIKYSINILPSILQNEEKSLMDCLGKTPELNIFETKVVSDLLSFKWNGTSGLVHKIGAITHVAYLLVFSFFVNEMYVYEEGNGYRTLLYFLIIMCLIYPFTYDMTQLKR